MKQTRRSVLATVALVGGAGCLSAPGGAGDSDEAPTSKPSTTIESTEAVTTTTSDMASLSIQDVTTTPGIVDRYTADTIAVYGARTEQFVIADVSADGSPAPSPEDLRLETDDEVFGVDQQVGGMGRNLWDFGEPYAEGASGWVAFTLPKPHQTGTASITWPVGEYELSEDQCSVLSRPPTSFELLDFSVPESIGVDEDAPLTLSVANTGEVDGTWIGAVNRSGPSVAYIPELSISLDVAAGETVTRTYINTPDDRYGRVAGEMTFSLRWRDNRLSRSVSVVEND